MRSTTLGVAVGDAEVIVVSEPKTGLFGRMRVEARVRARVRPVGARPERERSRDRNRSGKGGQGSSGPWARTGLARERDAASRGLLGQARGSGSGTSRSARRRRNRSQAGPGARSTAQQNGASLTRLPVGTGIVREEYAAQRENRRRRLPWPKE